MPLLFQSWMQKPGSPKPGSEETKEKPLALEQQHGVAKEALDHVGKSLHLLGYDVGRLQKLYATRMDEFDRLAAFKNAKQPKAKASEANRQAAAEEFNKALLDLQWLNDRLPGVAQNKYRATDKDGLKIYSPDESRKLSLGGLVQGNDAYPTPLYFYNLKQVLDSYVLESTPKKK